MQIHRFVFLVFFTANFFLLRADEGMWLPMLLEQLNEQEMQDMGMRITAEDIYSINQGSMKDGMLLFGSGCTGSLISPEGLLITNHHCGLGVIQSHSSVEQDYIQQGFWAQERSEELSNPGLTVTFLVRMEHVTDRVLADAEAIEDPEARAKVIQARIQELEQEATAGTHYEATVKPFYQGNEYYLIVSEKFLDVRLVGAPPQGIGSYGGDMDNWVWPRHAGDFSLFRIYTAPDGSPAPYASENVPLASRHFFPISTRGVQEGDFAMIMGFPYRTQEYLSAEGVSYIQEVEHPIRVALRHERLAIMDEAMAQSDRVRIQYAKKQSSVANGYKKWKGAIRGLKRAEAVAAKQAYEASFTERVQARPAWRTRYGDVLDQLAEAYQTLRPVAKAYWYFQEAGYSIELVRFAAEFGQWLSLARSQASPTQFVQEEERLRKAGRGFYKNYASALDQRIMARMLALYAEAFPPDQLPELIRDIQTGRKYQGNFDAYAADVFAESALADSLSFQQLLQDLDASAIEKDPAYELMASLVSHYYQQILPTYQRTNARIEGLNKLYMQAQREVFSEKRFYPDANFSLRVSYGKVEGYQPRDGVRYRHYTTLEGAVDKYLHRNETGAYQLPKRLLELYLTKDYGPYGSEGQLPLAFITSTHTTGGNSGSPVFNGDGHLIGLYFDRNWEGTMSDIFYDRAQCRGISVDIRYILFLIDKFANAGYLLDELQLKS